MKTWQAISNGGQFYVQLQHSYTIRENSRGRYIRYRSIEGAKRAADKLNSQMKHDASTLFAEAHTHGKWVDHINGDITDNRLENLRIVTLGANQ